MERYSKLKKNLGALFLGSFSTKLLSFIFIRFYTSVLATEEYGIADLITTTVSLLYPVLTAMINEALTRMLLDKNGYEKNYFTVSFRFNIISIGVFLILSPFVLLFHTLAPFYFLFVLYYISFNIHSFMINFARGVDRIKETAIAGVISTVAIISCNIVFLLVFRFGINGYLASSIIGTTISSLYMVFKIKPSRFLIGIEYNKRRSVLKELLVYSLPLIPNTISWWISNSSDRYFVTAICGADINGIYSVAYKIPTILTAVYSIFISAWRLSAVEDFGSKESNIFFCDVHKKVCSILYLTAGGLFLFNKVLASILYANDFFLAYTYAPMLVLSALYSGFSEFYGTIYTSNKSTVPLFLTSFLGAILNIVLNAILIPLGNGHGFGALGAALATLISYMVIYIVRTVHTRRIMIISHSIIEWVSQLLLILMMGFSIFMSDRYIIQLSAYILLVALNIQNVMSIVVDIYKRRFR